MKSSSLQAGEGGAHEGRVFRKAVRHQEGDYPQLQVWNFHQVRNRLVRGRQPFPAFQRAWVILVREAPCTQAST